ncbi:MAG: DUF5703 domain-containing protein [Planctomycetaceae bacterium]|nr:DUF5703 domain-containing protein [Planctomycetaceae bacterium]
MTHPPQQYNVIWDSPSADSAGSMPIGNGDIGVNLWAQAARDDAPGSLVLLISKTDAWSEQGQLLKLARVRVTFTPDPLAASLPFRQELCLHEGQIVIQAGAITLRAWVDANNPAIHIEAHGPEPFEMQAALELWRTEAAQAGTINGLSGDARCRRPACAYPDTIVDAGADRLVWYHRNESSIYAANIEHQGLGGFEHKADPLLGRTFGAVMRGAGLVRRDTTHLAAAAPAKKFTLSICPLSEVTPTPKRWLDNLAKLEKSQAAIDIEQARTAHVQWWDAFWNRSYIYIDGDEKAQTVCRRYILQRWVSACGGRGGSPIKFNGSIFCFEHQGDPDYRAWGGAYWWQNTRLPYWPMLASGDWDMMQPVFEMYARSLPLARHRTKVWFKHAGAFIPETMYFWGLHTNGDYGLDRTGLRVGDMTNRYIRREYTSSPELLAMMLDYYEYTLDEKFLVEVLIPAGDDLLTFWDQHYELDADGAMCMYPAQSLETWQDAVNPTPDIAGLAWVLARLAFLPPKVITSKRQALWDRLAAKVPPLPVKQEEQGRYILPAAQVLQDRGNGENPELYAVFPFRLFGVGKENIEVGRETYKRRTFPACVGWHQNDTQAALLGMAEEAARQVAERAGNKNPEARFPVFWGPNFDWTPDQCHGGNLLMAVQTMLLQADDGKIYLLPAWPKEWSADFKLRAPGRTTVEASVRDGKIVSLTVTPKARQGDVVAPE